MKLKLCNLIVMIFKFQFKILAISFEIILYFIFPKKKFIFPNIYNFYIKYMDLKKFFVLMTM